MNRLAAPFRSLARAPLGALSALFPAPIPVPGPFLAALLLLWPASPAPAHPHVFVDAGIEITLDPDGRLEAITVTWIYDEYYSLLITEELGLDPDYDGVLTAEETATLTGFDMNWAPGFNGDLEATLDGAPLALSGPEAATAALRPDGRILTTHRRAVPARPAMAGRVLSLKPYDESYYTAYEVPQPPVLTGDAGSDCQLQRLYPDIDGQLEQMRQMLLSIDADADLEENDIPLIGAQFATEIRLTCPAR